MQESIFDEANICRQPHQKFRKAGFPRISAKNLGLGSHEGKEGDDKPYDVEETTTRGPPGSAGNRHASLINKDGCESM